MASSNYYIQDNADIEFQKSEAARSAYQSGDYQTALRLYLDLLNSKYTYKLCYEVGRCYYKLADMVNAELYFTRSVNLEEYKNPSYTYLGNICHKKNDISKAIEYWITSYSYKPDDSSVCLNLATSYFSKGMKFYSVYFYEKFLKYAKDKSSSSYLEIKKSMEGFSETSENFYKKALRAVSMNDNETAKQALEYALTVYPASFDINNLLGKIYYTEKDYIKAQTYFEHALCIDSKSVDVLKYLSSAGAYLDDLSGSYCCLKRMLPLVISRQKDYYDIVKTTNELLARFDSDIAQKHVEKAKEYYNNNDYYHALFEYENCIILDNNLSDKYNSIVQKIKLFLHPEERIIKSCMEKGALYHSTGDFNRSNKYFSKIMSLAEENSSEYKLAKSRIVNA